MTNTASKITEVVFNNRELSFLTTSLYEENAYADISHEQICVAMNVAPESESIAACIFEVVNIMKTVDGAEIDTDKMLAGKADSDGVLECIYGPAIYRSGDDENGVVLKMGGNICPLQQEFVGDGIIKLKAGTQQAGFSGIVVLDRPTNQQGETYTKLVWRCTTYGQHRFRFDVPLYTPKGADVTPASWEAQEQQGTIAPALSYPPGQGSSAINSAEAVPGTYKIVDVWAKEHDTKNFLMVILTIETPEGLVSVWAESQARKVIEAKMTTEGMMPLPDNAYLKIADEIKATRKGREYRATTIIYLNPELAGVKAEEDKLRVAPLAGNGGDPYADDEQPPQELQNFAQMASGAVHNTETGKQYNMDEMPF